MCHCQAKETARRGLPNLTDTCWLNAVFQLVAQLQQKLKDNNPINVQGVVDYVNGKSGSPCRAEILETLEQLSTGVGQQDAPEHFMRIVNEHLANPEAISGSIARHLICTQGL